MLFVGAEAIQLSGGRFELSDSLIDSPLRLECRADPRQELAIVHRFSQEVIRARLDPANPILSRLECGHDDNRYKSRRRVFLQHATHRYAVDIRHDHIEQDQVGRVSSHLVQRLPTAVRRIGRVTAIAELLNQQVDVQRLVVDDQDAGKL